LNTRISGSGVSDSFNYWFIRLRWVACIVALAMVLITIPGLHYLESETLKPLMAMIGILALSNLIYTYFLKKDILNDYLGEIQVVADLFILTLMLAYSGGIENPISFVYLFHIILSGILFNKVKCYSTVGLSFALFTLLALGDLYQLIPHYTLHIYPHGDLDAHHIHASHYPLYVWSMMGIQLAIQVLTAYFITAIMDRLRGEEKRSQEEQRRLQKVLEATEAGLIILNKDSWPIWHNNPIRKWVAVTDSNWDASILAWLQNIKVELDDVWESQTIIVVEREQFEAEGTKYVIQITIAPLIDDHGSTYQAVALIQDITDVKILESELIHGAKMASIGAMATGVAHEVGNPLASISTRLQLMQVDDSSEFLQESIPLLQNEIARIERIVHGISQFGRPSPNDWEPFSVNKIVQESIEIIKYHDLASTFKIDLDLDSTLPDIIIVRDQLKQAILNLLLNALESETDKKEISIQSYRSDRNIIIKFRDYGKGISSGAREKIFEPFFTTKNSGSGLGLFIVHQIIQAHSGLIEVESEPGQGTVFMVTLPVQTARKSNNMKVRRNS